MIQSKYMFGDHPLGGKRPFFADISLLSLTVSPRYGLRKAPSLSKTWPAGRQEMTLFSSKSNHQICTKCYSYNKNHYKVI